MTRMTRVVWSSTRVALVDQVSPRPSADPPKSPKYLRKKMKFTMAIIEMSKKYC